VRCQRVGTQWSGQSWNIVNSAHRACGCPFSASARGRSAVPGAAVRRLGHQRRDEARRLIDICLEAGVNLFDTADVYSNGASEEVLGEAIKGRRDAVLISTKTGLPMGDGPADWGVSRSRLIRAVEDALKRLGTDHIDLLQLHAFDASTPAEELMATLDSLVSVGQGALHRRLQLSRLGK
jgi:aryl-alcohol dehydrogenase-like predicted oxidoreductase